MNRPRKTPRPPSHSRKGEIDGSGNGKAATGADGLEATLVAVTPALVVAGVVGAGVVDAATVRDRGDRRGCAVDRSQFHHCGGEQAGDTGERCRHAGRIVGRGDRAESRETVDVRLGGRQADGLDVHTLDRGDRVVQRRRAALVLAVRQQHEHPVLDARRELLAGGDHGVVQRSVAAGDDPVDLFDE